MEPAAVLDEIQQLAERRHRDPASVLSRVTQLVEASKDARVEASGSLAAGLALQELGRIKEAARSYRRAVDVSTSHGLAKEEALARAQLAIALLNLGDAVQAEREVRESRATAPPAARGMVEMLYGLVLQRTGRHDEALGAYRRALRLLERAGDVTSIARLRLNRGIIYAYQDELAPALEDLGEAERIAIEHELPLLTAMAAHNIAFAEGRRGRLPDALAAFERAERAYQALESPHRLLAVLEADRCQILLLAGLVVEARRAAEAAVAALEQVGDRAHLTESRLLLARALLAEGKYERAADEAFRAARGFRAAGWLPWAALARYVAIQAEVLAVQDEHVPPAGLLSRCRRIAAELEAHGWPVEALHVRTFAGRVALALDRPAIARAELAQAGAARRRGTAELRAQAWLATALLRLAEEDRRGAKRALARGIAVVDEYRATLGATELRANAASHGRELARLGVSLALADGRPRDVLCWAERWRAGALRASLDRPATDEHLASSLRDLRRVRSELLEASLNPGSRRALHARAAAFEEAVRQRTLQIKDDRPAVRGAIDVPALRRALGQRTLVEYVAHGQRLYALTVTHERVRLHELGPTAPVEEEKRYLLFALHRLLWGRSRASAQEAVVAAGSRLDQLLVSPLPLDRDRPLVIVPTGLLHNLPWPGLPSLVGSELTIAPSASLWLAPGGTGPVPSTTRRVVLVAGPQLPGAEAEVDALARLYGEADVLAGPEATAANVLAAMEEADVVHLAAHGSFRADSPLFSSVLLADGPLTVYDLEQVKIAPRLVVLSACDAAVAEVRTGDELLGSATALLGLGVPTVIAPVLPVSDDATVSMMVSLHERLREGERPALALAHAAAAQGDRVAASAFLCIGGNEATTRAEGNDGGSATGHARSAPE
ncbi:MAG: CHAT domain-containing tetratricopeptide repeat protein [Actinomycetota bacterium]|nr:CHAT domain-containing tetratricopeptide repeat protein [Actinomycetota bacterium]